MSVRRVAMPALWTLVATASMSGLAASPVVMIDWDTRGAFERRVAVAPGKFAELCGALRTGDSVRWTFETGEPLDFNIHYHDNNDVRMPAQAHATRGANGVLDVVVNQDYCWMWSNNTPTQIDVDVKLSRGARAR